MSPAAKLALSALLLATTARAEPASLVYLNGTPSPVFFNDGDSFRVLAGPLVGNKARLAGYNTLESFGPVHQWGDWTAKELYVIAKMATLNARRGVWHCESDMKTDTYGRTLWWCPDLAEDQVRRGLAHAMSVNEQPARPAIIQAQREAIKARRGLWAHGVPNYVLTSIHSNDERPGEDGSYNRLVSTVDGHSRKWAHTDNYAECQVICFTEGPAEARLELAGRLKRVAGLPDALEPAALVPLLEGGPPPESLTGEQVTAARSAVNQLRVQGWLEAAASEAHACMTHTDFRRRYGSRKAACLE